jgi:hypothetical protein
MASITSWTRLEPRSERHDLADGLAAHLHDPLWQLARQWQIGEFTAEDTGSPVQARVRLEHSALNRFRAGPEGGPLMAWDPRAAPLEATVEDEPEVPTARGAAVAGLRFVELLTLEGGPPAAAKAFTSAFALTAADDGRLDDAGRRFLAVVAGRAPDGVQLRAACGAAPGAVPAGVSVARDDRQVTAAVRAYVAWYDAEHRPVTPTSTWQRERMEYEFAVAAPSATPGRQIVLDGPEYAGGRLDWPTFDRHIGAALGVQENRAATIVTRTVIPSRVSYRGMPAARWWEFEDATVDFGRVEAGPADLLRLLLVAFAVDYGNDWFVLPVELDVGAVYRVRSLVVTDGFGTHTLVRSAAQVDGTRRDWRMYSPAPVAQSLISSAPADDSAELLVLAPAADGVLEGEVLEDVVLLRDEMVNLAWAVERTVEGIAGGRIDRSATAQGGTPAVRQGEGDGLRYRLSTTVPAHWLPLVPVRIDPGKPDIRLRRGRALLDRDGEPVTPVALGRILDPEQPLDLREEEVPRAGARITRSRHLVRWTNGTSHRWVGRRKRPAGGEAWSGLRFDVVEPDD